MLPQLTQRCECCGRPLTPRQGKVCKVCEIAVRRRLLAIRNSVPQDTAATMIELGELTRQCVGVTYDPSAPTHGQRFVACVGLDAYGAGSRPVDAINDAIAEFVGQSAEKVGA